MFQGINFLDYVLANGSICIEKKRKVTKQKFSPEEDKIIFDLVGNQKYPNWNEIAKHIPGKTCRQCRERYQHYLAPGLSKEPWSKEEDDLIIELYKKYGSNWALIAKHFQNRRTNNGIKNRFNNHLKKQIQKQEEILFEPFSSENSESSSIFVPDQLDDLFLGIDLY